MNDPIPFIDLSAQRARIRDKIDARLAKVIDEGAYVQGPEIFELERQLSAFGGMDDTIVCGSGTDALALPLMAWGIKPGDAVFVPSFTFAATAEVVAWLGATPIFVDVLGDTFNLDPENLQQAIDEVVRAGRLTPRVVIAVDLFGQAADYPAIRAICDAHGLKLISDAAQGFGATLSGKMASAWADVVSTSFYPAKPLACYGDGGALQTNDVELAAIIRSLRIHGYGTDKYDNVRIGMNGRMDTIQAAILLEKLAIFPEEIEARMAIAARYEAALADLVTPQRLLDGAVSTWAQYTVKLPAARRDAFMAAMKSRGVPTVIYYGKPLHRQTAYKHFPTAGNGLPVSDRLSGEVVSLPMHAYLDAATQDRVIAAARESLAEAAEAA
ncbi:DegT/DnrJ/EryC1/StrS family aminotransferase [Mangrovibrevibacter kandeliae]|uniref:DegT/DnrJ/EryC1/StrS family aminotransferase n=1 Tax=Mangrovibrevibacter kandeliae TaxID=2968473 RepID=UPI002117E343|nr:DegT/DnrJ/EryC1/StrS aminotransferase family protein [Aurantimonas sp. CSK15Z-1]MCQ8784046.1 DegT/DnrJ/EryC1/StrS aminotransferase family protein [Aurantimonas sp. CSK15Z-1]